MTIDAEGAALEGPPDGELDVLVRASPNRPFVISDATALLVLNEDVVELSCMAHTPIVTTQRLRLGGGETPLEKMNQASLVGVQITGSIEEVARIRMNRTAALGMALNCFVVLLNAGAVVEADLRTSLEEMFAHVRGLAKEEQPGG